MEATRDPADEFKRQVVEAIFKATGIDPIQVDKLLEKPPEDIGADYAFPCFVLAKKQGRHPAQIAKEVAGKLRPSGLIKEVKVRDAYVNFSADWEKLAEMIVSSIIKAQDSYGSGEKLTDKVLIEHTSANPDGPLHLGHFRNTVIGDSLARIFKLYGYNVKTDFLFNTTGRQIAIAAWEFRKLGGKLKGATGPYAKKPDWIVLEFYKKGNQEIEKNPGMEDEIKEMMRQFETGDKGLVSLYKEIVDKALEGHKKTLGSIGVKIDSFVDESKFLFGGQVDAILSEIKKRVDVGKIDGKRVWVDLKQFGIDREFNLTRSDGTTLYPLRDLAYHENKFSRADININVMGTDQKFYFKQVTSTLSLLFPEKTKKYTIVFYEFLTLPEGTMSTRLGRFVSVDELLDRATAMAMDVVEKKMPNYTKKEKESIARTVGVGALKYAMVKVSPEKTYAFSVEDALSFEGDNAPYIQYTHARARSILAKSEAKSPKPGTYSDPKELTLISTLKEFPRVVDDAVRDYRPHYIANYVYKLASQFNDFYQSVPVLKAEQRESRLALVKASAIVIKNSLGLLGIEAPEKM